MKNQAIKTAKSMTIIGIFSGFNMFCAWLLLFLFSQFLFKNRNEKLRWFMLGILGALFLLVLLINHGTTLLSGFLVEQIVFLRRTRPIFLFFQIFELIVAVVCSLALFRPSSASKSWRMFQLSLVVLYLSLQLLLLPFALGDFATSVIPGWHATIIDVGNVAGIFFWLLILVLVEIVYDFHQRNTRLR